MVSEEMKVSKNKSDGFRYELLAKNRKEVKNQNHAKKSTNWISTFDFQVEKLCTAPPGSTFSRLEMDILKLRS
jgi:hypothetical protein